MAISDKTFITILDAFVHGPFFNELDIKIKTGFEKFAFEKIIADIKKGTVQAAACNKINTPELYEMITKSLALLTEFPHGHESELKLKTGYSKQALANLLKGLWGKPVIGNEYDNILNQ